MNKEQGQDSDLILDSSARDCAIELHGRASLYSYSFHCYVTAGRFKPYGISVKDVQGFPKFCKIVLLLLFYLYYFYKLVFTFTTSFFSVLNFTGLCSRR